MQIIFTGSIAIDRIMLFPGSFDEVIQPDKLHIISLSILLDHLEDTRGGVAANMAYTAALLGEQPILLGSIGSDEGSKAYMKDLEKMGVDTQSVHYSKKPTATFTVMTDKKNCQIGGFYPGAMSDAKSLTLQKFVDQDVFVVISPHDPEQMAAQVSECKKQNLRLFYDAGQQINNITAVDIRAGVEAAELLILNDYEFGVMIEKTGWSEKEICQKVKMCVVTLGDQGCRILTKEKTSTVPAAQAEKVIDPTGAGDAFRAGFLYGYVRNFLPEVCARFGMITSAYAIEKQGTQAHSFTKEEFQQRYEANFGPLPDLDK